MHKIFDIETQPVSNVIGYTKEYNAICSAIHEQIRQAKKKL